MATKEKGINLGTLQAEYEEARKQFITDEKALGRAEASHDASRERMQKAKMALMDASKAVLK